MDQNVGGFGDEPGIKVQLMNLIRSVRTVMRGMPVFALLSSFASSEPFIVLSSFPLVPLIAVNSVCIVLLLLFG